MAEESQDFASYDVGYGKPPEHAAFVREVRQPARATERLEEPRQSRPLRSAQTGASERTQWGPFRNQGRSLRDATCEQCRTRRPWRAATVFHPAPSLRRILELRTLRSTRPRERPYCD